MSAQSLNDRIFPAVLKMQWESEAAIKRFNRLAATSELKSFPAAVLGQYRKDVADLNRARKAFDAEWSKLVKARGKPDRTLLAAFDAFSLHLSAIKAANERLQALADARAAATVAAILGVVLGLHLSLAKEGTALLTELSQLQLLLRKATVELNEARAQRAVNAALTAVTLCIPPLNLVGRIVVTAGTATTQLLLDAALGVRKGDVKGMTNTVFSGFPGAAKDAGVAAGKCLPIVAAVATLKSDGDEVAEAGKILQLLRRRSASVTRRLRKIISVLKSEGPKMTKAQKQLDALSKRVHSALARANDHQHDYDQIRKLLRQAR